jgi:hypothetical protein
MCSTSPRLLGLTAATLPLLLSFTRKTAYTTKRNINDEIQYVQTIEGTQFPKGLILVQQKIKHYVQYAWLPSLVLGDLGRAQLVPIACKGSSLGLALRPTKA